MDGAAYVMLSGALTFGIPLALAVRELIVLRRRDDRGWDNGGPPPSAPKPPPYDWGKPLPDCLIPSPPSGVRGRALEDA
jgi:hypothetical protein